MANNRCLIVDAYNLFVRHYVANPTMSKNGEQIGGIVGFYNNLSKLIIIYVPNCVNYDLGYLSFVAFIVAFQASIPLW